MRRAILLTLIAALTVSSQPRRPEPAYPEASKLISKVYAGQKFATGLIWSRDGFVLFSDRPSGKLIKIDAAGPHVFREGLSGPAGLALDDDGRIYVCESRARRVIRIDKKDHVEVVAEKYDGKHFNAPNDIAVAKGGHVYFTDPAFASAAETRELPFDGIYYVSPKGAVTLLAKPSGRPNGIALAPDGKTLYVADSDNRAVLAYPLSNHATVGPEQKLIGDIPGVPDGLRVDKAGNLYVAARSMLVYSPAGKLRYEIPLSEKPSSSTLGEADLGILFIAARTSIYRVRLDAWEENH
jgi:gluconolactonase